MDAAWIYGPAGQGTRRDHAADDRASSRRSAWREGTQKTERIKAIGKSFYFSMKQRRNPKLNKTIAIIKKQKSEIFS